MNTKKLYWPCDVNIFVQLNAKGQSTHNQFICPPLVVIARKLYFLDTHAPPTIRSHPKSIGTFLFIRSIILLGQAVVSYCAENIFLLLDTQAPPTIRSCPKSIGTFLSIRSVNTKKCYTVCKAFTE